MVWYCPYKNVPNCTVKFHGPPSCTSNHKSCCLFGNLLVKFLGLKYCRQPALILVLSQWRKREWRKNGGEDYDTLKLILVNMFIWTYKTNYIASMTGFLSKYHLLYIISFKVCWRPNSPLLLELYLDVNEISQVDPERLKHLKSLTRL